MAIDIVECLIIRPSLALQGSDVEHGECRRVSASSQSINAASRADRIGIVPIIIYAMAIPKTCRSRHADAASWRNARAGFASLEIAALRSIHHHGLSEQRP
jgi:hypothetical protein